MIGSPHGVSFFGGPNFAFVFLQLRQLRNVPFCCCVCVCVMRAPSTYRPSPRVSGGFKVYGSPKTVQSQAGKVNTDVPGGSSNTNRYDAFSANRSACGARVFNLHPEHTLVFSKMTGLHLFLASAIVCVPAAVFHSNPRVYIPDTAGIRTCSQNPIYDIQRTRLFARAWPCCLNTIVPVAGTSSE